MGFPENGVLFLFGNGKLSFATACTWNAAARYCFCAILLAGVCRTRSTICWLIFCSLISLPARFQFNSIEFKVKRRHKNTANNWKKITLKWKSREHKILCHFQSMDFITVNLPLKREILSDIYVYVYLVRWLMIHLMAENPSQQLSYFMGLPFLYKQKKIVLFMPICMLRNLFR
jgi:hypothetical protein